MSGDQFTLSCSDDLESTLSFLEVGLNGITLGENKKFTLVLGNTGCGKTTFVQWIAGDDSKLNAEEKGPFELVIQDNTLIGDSVLNSMTLIPELIVRNGENFYDCPGFSDTRSASHEIVNIHFLKYLCDHVESMKIILVVDYSSVRFGRNKIDLMNMVSSAVDFIKDIEKFQQSIMLLVTKVENITKLDNEGRLVIASDEIIIESTSEYLKAMIIEIQREIKAQTQTVKLEFYSKALKIFEILISQQDKIALFRAPIQKGKLNELRTFREGKEKIWRMINESVKFTSSTKTDFGYTISDKCENLIAQMIQKINDNLKTSVTAVALKIQNDASLLIEAEISFIHNFDHTTCEISNAEDFIRRLIEIKEFIEIACRDETTFHHLENHPVIVTAGEVALIKNQLKYFAFLQTVSKTKLSNFNLSSVFQRTATILQSLEIKVKDKSRGTSNLIKSKIKEQMEQLGNEYMHYFKKIYGKNQQIIENFPRNVEVSDPQRMSTKLREIDDSILRITDLAENLDTKNFIQRLEIPDGLECIRIHIENILKLENNMRYLKIISNTELFDESLHETHVQQLSIEIQQLKTQFFQITMKKSAGMTRDIGADIKSKASLFKSFIDKKIEAFDLINLPTTLQNFLQTFQNLCETNNIQNLATEIRSIKNVFNIDDPSKVLCSLGLESMVSSQGFLLELNQEISFNLVNSLNQFSTVYNYLEEYRKWFVFLKSLYLELSDYSIQKNRDSYNVENLAAWGNEHSSISMQGIEITQQNYHDFLNIMRRLGIDGLDGVSCQFQEPKLIQLNRVLDKTLKSKFQIDRSNQKLMTIRGEFIKFSDFVDENGKLNIEAGQEIEELKIFALCSVFLDRDLDAIEHKLKLVIITPKLKICGQKRIVMDGKNAEPLDKINNRQPGSNGRAGNPGQTAGSFFAVVGEIINGENLTVSLNGGQGGKGEDGEEGKEGKKGDNVEKGFFGAKRYRKEHLFKYFGFEGEDGQKGGDGGKPGLGGLPGSFKSIVFSGEQIFSVMIGNGRMGEAGRGGIGGKGGRYGDNYYSDPSDPKCIVPADFRQSTEFSDSGADGKSGTAGSQLNPSLPPQIDIRLSIDQYKTFLIGNLNTFYTSDLKKFYLSFSENEEINQICTIFSLLNEFNALNRNLRSDNNEYLNDLLTRIGSRLEGSTTDDEKKILQVLQIAVCSKINLKTEKRHSSLIIDIERYLLAVERQIKLFENFHRNGNKREIVKKLTSNFSCDIDRKIKDAQELIEKM